MPTPVRENRAKKMLKNNELILVMGVNQLRTPNIAMISAACGFDDRLGARRGRKIVPCCGGR